MQPSEIRKLIGRSKLKRVREKDEARKREDLWSKSREGLKIICGNCYVPGHNRRKCPLLQKEREVLQDVLVSTSQPSEEIESIIMPTLGFVASSSQHTSQVINEAPNPSKRSKVVASSSPIVDEDEV